MDFLGIGPLEILFILLIVLIIFGPKDIVKAGQSTGRFLRKLVMSSGWQSIQQTSKDLRNLPNKLIREAGLEEMKEDVNELARIAKPPDFKKEIKAELDKVKDDLDDVAEGLSAWTSSNSIQVSTKEKPPAEEKPAVVEKPPEQTENT
jgi:Sec-independent protein translocase protein TatA